MPPIAECERMQLGPFKIDKIIKEIPVGGRAAYTLADGSKAVLQGEINGFADLTNYTYYSKGEELLLADGKIAKATDENRVVVRRKKRSVLLTG